MVFPHVFKMRGERLHTCGCFTNPSQKVTFWYLWWKRLGLAEWELLVFKTQHRANKASRAHYFNSSTTAAREQTLANISSCRWKRAWTVCSRSEWLSKLHCVQPTLLQDKQKWFISQEMKSKPKHSIKGDLSSKGLSLLLKLLWACVKQNVRNTNTSCMLSWRDSALATEGLSQCPGWSGLPLLRIPLCWHHKSPGSVSRSQAAQGENCFGKLKKAWKRDQVRAVSVRCPQVLDPMGDSART